MGHRILRTLAGIALLVALRLAGDALAAGLALPLPGPVLGMGIALALLFGVPALRPLLLDGSALMMTLLGALIVPAAVGLQAFAPLLGRQALALAAVLLLSTLITGLVTAGVYRALVRR